MKSSGNAVNWVVVLMAASSLVSMICLFQVDKIVNGDLYNHGLNFSYDWAIPYWTLTKTAFLVGWINIIAAIGVQLYNVRFRRKEVEELVSEVENEVMKTEIASIKVDDQKTQEPKPAETENTKEQQKEMSAPPKSPETQEKTKQKQTPIEDAANQTQAESGRPEEAEEQKKESEAETKETPILVGVTEEEISPTA